MRTPEWNHRRGRSLKILRCHSPCDRPYLNQIHLTELGAGQCHQCAGWENLIVSPAPTPIDPGSNPSDLALESRSRSQ